MDLTELYDLANTWEASAKTNRSRSRRAEYEIAAIAMIGCAQALRNVLDKQEPDQEPAE